MKSYKIMAVLDGRPGHEKQTQGIIRALETYLPVDVSFQTIKISFVSELIAWVKALAGFLVKPGQTNAVDFVVGTGTHTHAHVIRIGHASGAKKIICMSPASFLTQMFDLCFVPAHDRVKSGENIFFTTGPPNISENKKCHQPDKGLILIGGTDDKSHVWNSDKLLEYIDKILSLSPAGMNWTISSSPRTPAEMEDNLNRLAAGRDRVVFFRFSDTKKGWVEQQYDAAGIVWVTADSMSMVYEALTAGCTTCIIPMEWKHEKNKFSLSEQDLYARNLAVSYADWSRTQDYIHTGKSLNESDTCAREILRRWCPENLP